MKQLNVLSAATLLALAAAVGAAETATKPPVAKAAAVARPGAVVPAHAPFSTLDKDGDASLLQTDFPTQHDLSTDLFAAFDTNRDQRLSSDEYSVYSGADDDSEGEEEEEGE